MVIAKMILDLMENEARLVAVLGPTGAVTCAAKMILDRMN